MTDKLEQLKGLIQSYGRVLVAYSGGADSAFVLRVAREVLGKANVTAVIAKSPSLPESEFQAAKKVADEIDAELLVVETEELKDPGYAANSNRRCFFCKSELYSRLLPIARERGGALLINGTNRDDLGDWRPGLEAGRDYGVKSPLTEAGFGKEEVRFYSRQLGLSTAEKPQAACLASRVPFGTEVTEERLRQIEAAEEILKQLRFNVVRVRWIERSALMEVGPEEVSRFFRDREIRENVLVRLKKLGFDSVAIDPEGYLPGRFNPCNDVEVS